MGRKIRLTESEFHRLIKRLVIETQEEMAAQKEMEEGWLANKFKGMKRFATGYGDEGEFESKRGEFMKKLEEFDKEVMENPDGYIKGGDWDNYREMLISKAEENKFMGELVRRNSPRSDKTFIVYFPGSTELQQMASGAAGGVRSGYSKTMSNESYYRKRNRLR